MNIGATEGSEEDSYRFNPWRARECLSIPVRQALTMRPFCSWLRTRR